MFKDFTWQAFLMGLIASVVGFASSFAIVIGGLIAVGASPE
jgi:predicted benzoate:H+ symporter BenE